MTIKAPFTAAFINSATLKPGAQRDVAEAHTGRIGSVAEAPNERIGSVALCERIGDANSSYSGRICHYSMSA